MPVLYLTIVGVVLTTGGASIIGWNDLMSEDKALDIGVLPEGTPSITK